MCEEERGELDVAVSLDSELAGSIERPTESKVAVTLCKEHAPCSGDTTTECDVRISLDSELSRRIESTLEAKLCLTISVEGAVACGIGEEVECGLTSECEVSGSVEEAREHDVAVTLRCPHTV